MMYVVNLALRRPDGKIETDTFFTEKKPTQETANEIAEKHNCSAIVAICGIFKEYSEAQQEKNIWLCEKREDYLPQSNEKEVENEV